ncbi:MULTISPECIES: PQQ-dependent sugar dehydrogenase [unclassified Streptomyces]|uniref:PQQ-dependent sugar dehydrogenase n=1 Tax=unclassified Streptomyces TaxID=2593676 RepID=UPI0016610676|nr:MULTISPECIES: PQQ-dependent sugar dehydrogenase [unclassified Streptomyces]MBD0710585.1 glucose sorbosone dehydrogenase [Streptomyces sp. CBMA291]MBD0715432.1 glucose sorbosone dehydrogenase [Streptomyces sp. CBMA370]
MSRPAVRNALWGAALSVLIAGCVPNSPADGPARSATTRPPAPPGGAKVTGTLAEGLPSPWGLAALPGGDLLVSSRDERTVTRIDGRTGARSPLGEVPGVVPGGEGGLLGLAVRDGWVYAYLTAESDNRIVRMRYGGGAGDRLGAPEPVFTGIPKGRIHNGGRIAFGPDGMLYAGTGETGRTGLAQDRSSLGGKILRLTPEGAPAPGNPFPGSPVYSYGHRNVQGFAWDGDGRLWAAEFGQDTWDELNLVEPGRNYGWPVVEGRAGRAGFVDPVAQWRTSEASPSGIAYARGAIWMAGLRGERLWRIPLSGEERSGDPRAFLIGEYGRLRTVLATGGGGLLVVTSETDGRGTPEPGDDRILRVEVD